VRIASLDLNAQFHKNTLYEIRKISLVGETAKAYQFIKGGLPSWIPKSVCEKKACKNTGLYTIQVQGWVLRSNDMDLSVWDPQAIKE